MKNDYIRLVSVLWMMILGFLSNSLCAVENPIGLESVLLSDSTTTLAKDAERLGNAQRGAILFHGAILSCSRCHATTLSDEQLLGPNLTVWETKPTTADLIHSVLRPSDRISDRYAATRVLTDDGKVLVGIVQSRTDRELRIQSGPSQEDRHTILLEEIESEQRSPISLMPQGQINSLQSRQQFFDLIKYLQVIAQGGELEAKRLQPKPEQLRLKIPEYESKIDHAGFIQRWDEKSLSRGEQIYSGLCANCHGTIEQPGSLPTALRFGQGKFKGGFDPYSLYQTLTHGRGMMLPQSWMVPVQKYDVIHYLRENFLRDRAPDQYTPVDEKYLGSLPKGDTFGPPPRKIEPWRTMDYGNTVTTTIEFPPQDGSNIAQKAIILRLDEGLGGVAQGNHWAAFEHDTLRWAGVWQGSEFVDWNGIQFNGKHNIHPKVMGDIVVANSTSPGWANPESGSFEDDARVVGRDGKRYGPLPNHWGKFRGLVRNGTSTLIEYSVGGINISETMEMTSAASQQTFVRHLEMGPREKTLVALVAELTSDSKAEIVAEDIVVITPRHSSYRKMVIKAIGLPAGSRFETRESRLCVSIAKSVLPTQIAIAHHALGGATIANPAQRDLDSQTTNASSSTTSGLAALVNSVRTSDFPKLDFDKIRQAGPPEWPQEIETDGTVWFDDGVWGVDELQVPVANPWRARVRVTGLDFEPRTRSMVVCTWDGDVWRVRGLENLGKPDAKLRWRRIAAGLFQPLGVVALDDSLMLTCRDQLVRLRDLNGDEEIDRYESFNSDHQVTEHFHEFAMGLQRDSAGNWYYAKSARHALTAIVPQHGTLLRVSPDGSKTEILAQGFRAANGVCLNPDGTFVVTDQEGHWNPKNRINWVEPGKFYGNMFGYHSVTDSSDSAMEQPLCWITNAFDRSPAELLWVTSPKWGSLNGSLLNLSYGYGKVYVVPFETVNGQKQGGMCALPIPELPTGMIRGRFSPMDGELYVGGMFAWASSRDQQEGGLFRVRRGDSPANLPVLIEAKNTVRGPEIQYTFSEPLDPASATETDRYEIRVWGLKRTKNYGSDHIDERTLSIKSARLSPDGKTLSLLIPDLSPTWCISSNLNLKTADGRNAERLIHHTIHKLGNDN